ncbi:AAA family ATPase [Burkholderia sp. IT-111MI5]|uniref:AAA family ATPase n=1 Tax=Burkholderia sp. IT-111MI5 TaxID=3026439 RepID=UPI0039E0C836
MSWQISRIEVSSFKAFKHILLDIDGSSLVTLDGPNGFGKTSIFDAIELLLTGKIKRINNLFLRLMTAYKKKYEDNLFWNVRTGESDLLIKIEFLNDDRTLVLARYAAAQSLKDQELNRADSFSQFGLFELSDFSSSDFSSENQRDDKYIDELFGRNFRENFGFLNYLEQGQNQLLFTRVDQRRDVLGSLFNITDIQTEIANCKEFERGFVRYLKDSTRQDRERELTAECEALKAINHADQGNVEYRKLSTASPQPGWDAENPFPAYSSDLFDQYQESIRKLHELLPLKNAVRVRVQNEQIEADVAQNMTSLRSLAQFGTDIKKLDALDNVRKELDLLANAKAVLQRGATVITRGEAQRLPGWDAERLRVFDEQIAARDSLRQLDQANAAVAAELTRLKAELLEEHAKIYPEDQACPLCGADWKAHLAMVQAIEGRSQAVANTLSVNGKALVELTTRMTEALASIATHVSTQESLLSSGYNEALHTALTRERVRLPVIEQLAERLLGAGTSASYAFTANAEEVDTRLQDLLTSMRSKRTAETESLPEDWQRILTGSFGDVQDFYLVEQQALADKRRYVSIKANEARNARLQKSLESLKQIQSENSAAARASEKMRRLRNTLEEVERTYADHTISEIELIFHIYSGRLIQNYQRGLGLFIESRDGKQLRFVTAEKSDHDAVLAMSSGQISALSLAFFLSLNKVYAGVPLILIDDPSQSLDEVNVASLTDLLRCELKSRQLIVSSHEEDISSYMRYRFNKAGLSTRSLNMQLLVKGAS